MRAEYRFDYSKAHPNRFAAGIKKEAVSVILDPDVAEVFNSSEGGQRIPSLRHLDLAEAGAEASQSRLIIGCTGGNRNTMAWGAKKTEHAGAKKGTGAFYGRKTDAKRASSRRRRQIKKAVVNIELETAG